MNYDQRRAELADFLRTRRVALQPEEVGLPTRSSRRTPGLRREDVADLAGISACWYTRLEQARNIRVSDHVLNSLAEALRLNAEERDHLLALASEDARSSAHVPTDGVPPALQRILDSQHPHPAFALGPRFNILAWNQARTDVYGDLNEIPAEHRHMLWLFFGGYMHELIQNWEQCARSVLAEFRAATGLYVHEQWFTSLVRELSRNSAEFRSWWRQHEIEGHHVAARELRHPSVGRMVLEECALIVDDCSDRRIVLEIPQPGTGTENKLAELSCRSRSRAQSQWARNAPMRAPTHGPQRPASWEQRNRRF
ncbi:helix-turn-helix transcriptional regulator [Streptomyces sp. NBC_00257]|uniref:helix-turn-helix transcriptional regulator n=1 Tax=unclassified Streptomyces TaxID=2593676 RepID=UPI00224FFDC7|nr:MULTISPECIES: helix-turn-helix transcriptional regulator [unclassified Streptomyces]WTB53908.1 helix-turn-helix transcriptional regulator [Streptomyces sp. NBC_00826]WTH93204.1 helix-turn-helix transcriptional regulator [Streptomyces sp. NBC_00825]WTI01936.1 helix-turn-helix transcriptional regulator [Streptomyces sp. NBC_00822]MCX4867538.1 helix-turn-helix transcriptional regulator [Streptomyces sp. NBC_00906]MCX4898776.1 helix-turn-helix transcriptional regulator [Streptomyces sp. NBC_008